MTREPVPAVARIEHVEEAGKVFQDAFNAGDIDGLVSLFEPDAVLVPDPGKIVSGADALRETFAGVLATGARFERVKLFSPQRVKDIALATAEWNQLCRFRNWSPRHATWVYSCINPPSRSRRRR